MVLDARRRVAARKVSPADARRLIDLDITAAAESSSSAAARCSTSGTASDASKQYLQLLGALTDADLRRRPARRRASARPPTSALRDLLAAPHQSRAGLHARSCSRRSAWSSGRRPTPMLAFAEVWAPWTFLLPQTAGIRDDILRGSPLLLYAQVARRLDDFAAGRAAHSRTISSAPRSTPTCAPSTPGSPWAGCASRRRTARTRATRSSRCRETPADLDPAAGILTQGEGNVLSHVQLLARALGIPNVVLGPSAYQQIARTTAAGVLHRHAGRARHPQGGVGHDRRRTATVYDEYTRNQTRDARRQPRGRADRGSTSTAPRST